MITKLFKASIMAVLTAFLVSSCSGSTDYGMASEEGIAKIKELITTNIDLKEYKVYEIRWEEDNRERKLDNILSRIYIRYIDKKGNKYTMIINLQNGEFVVSDLQKDEKEYYSYEDSKEIKLDDINSEYILKFLNEGYDLFKAQEDTENYELKSIEKIRLYYNPIPKNLVKLLDEREDYRIEYGKLFGEFEINFTKNDEQPEVAGKHIWTNYYTIPFIINADGKVELDL